jgi:hypothetical protein
MSTPHASPSPVIVLVSSFYTAALEKPFADALGRSEKTASLISVPYNQLHTFLLDPGSTVPQDAPAKVVMLLRVEDLIRFELAALGKEAALDPETCVRIFRERTGQFLDVLNRVSRMRLLVLLCPAGRGAYDLQFLGNYARIAEHKIAAALRSQQRHVVVTWGEFETASKATNVFNVAGDRLGHVPFSPEGLEAVSEFLVTQLDRVPTEQLAGVKAGNGRLDLEQFLGSLEVQISAAPMSDPDEQPTLDLVRHTTHFINLPNRRWDRGNLCQLDNDRPATASWMVRVRDRFGDYGISGAVSFAVQNRVMRTGLLFLTCPVLGKQVEHALLGWMAGLAQEQEAEMIEIPLVKGRDNEVLCAFLSGISDNGTNQTSLPQGSETVFRLRVSGLADRIAKAATNPAAISGIVAKAQAA